MISACGSIESVGRLGVGLALVMALAVQVRASDDRDPLARARALYNQQKFDEALAAAEQARATPARADSADLIAARSYLERFRANAAAEDLARARERLRHIDPRKFQPQEQVEFMVGLGETLFFEESFGAAAEVFDWVLAQDGRLSRDERERVIDWWASALDREAQPRTEFERQAVYQQVRTRMQKELGSTLTSATAVYWLAVAARGQGDLQGSWEAAQAGWVRAPMASDRGAELRADIDRFVMTALVPERARALGQPPETLRAEWARFKERWTK
jgi:tetratricopeptide (TPR) repeat protein